MGRVGNSFQDIALPGSPIYGHNLPKHSFRVVVGGVRGEEESWEAKWGLCPLPFFRRKKQKHAPHYGASFTKKSQKIPTIKKKSLTPYFSFEENSGADELDIRSWVEAGILVWVRRLPLPSFLVVGLGTFWKDGPISRFYFLVIGIFFCVCVCGRCVGFAFKGAGSWRPIRRCCLSVGAQNPRPSSI